MSVNKNEENQNISKDNFVYESFIRIKNGEIFEVNTFIKMLNHSNNDTKHNEKKQSLCEHGKHKHFCKKCGGSKLCKSIWCETHANQKYDGYCCHCFIHLFPNHELVYNYKTKEKDVVDKITQSFSNFTWIADKKVQDGCSRRRPDLLLDMGSHIIIVEVDENKHMNYDSTCENKRMMELSQDLQHRPIVFIRFNPDNYIKDGELIKSCWNINNAGKIIISKNKEKEWEERIFILKQHIQYWIDHTTEKTIEIVELFY